MVTLNLSPTLQLTNEAFEQLCRQNPDLRLERTAQGELIAMAPAGSESARQNLSLSAQLWQWNQQTRLGVVFDSSAGFTLPNGAIRSPDALGLPALVGIVLLENNGVNLLLSALILC